MKVEVGKRAKYTFKGFVDNKKASTKSYLKLYNRRFSFPKFGSHLVGSLAIGEADFSNFA